MKWARALLLLLGLGLLLAQPAGGQVSPTTQCIASASASGTSDVITIPALPCALTTNLLILTTSAANQTTTPTLQPFGLTAQTIVRPDGTALNVGDISGAGYKALLNPTGSVWVLLNPAKVTVQAGLTIGNPISGGTPGDLLNVVSGPNLGQQAQSSLALAASQISGITTGSAPAAGNLGQEITGSTPSGSATGLTSGSAKNVPLSPLSLTAGSWACTGNVVFQNGSGTSATAFVGWISLVSGTEPSYPNGGAIAGVVTSAGSGTTTVFPVGTFYVNVASTTNVYLSGLATFSGGTESLYGAMNCTRKG